MNADCIFCKIVRGEVRASAAYRDEQVMAIEDVRPQAPSHALVLPLRHYATLAELVAAGDEALLGALFAAATKLGAERGGDDGFRLVVNSGRHGGQTVGHVHVHVLAGRPMAWPPG